VRIDVVTLFPAMFAGPFDQSIVARARSRGLLDLRVHDLRDYTADRHRTADDAPFGGGIGMVLKPEPLFRAVEALRQPDLPRARVALLSAQGQLFDDALARQLATLDQLILLCGHYEGVDERVAAHLADLELSIGDYVLTGGELPAMVVIDAVARYVPGVLEAEATGAESHAAGLLEHPHYTRPAEFRGWRVPSVLLSGDHAAIARWRRQQALLRTWQRRPELLQRVALSAEDRALLAEALAGPHPPAPSSPAERGRDGSAARRADGGQGEASAYRGSAEEAGASLANERSRAARLATLRQRYPGEWLLVRVTREAAGQPAAGVLLAHSAAYGQVFDATVRARALDPEAPLYLGLATTDGALVVTTWIGTLAVDVVLDLGSAATRLSPDALWLAGVAERRALRHAGRRLRVPALRVGSATLRDVEVTVEPPPRAAAHGALGTALLAALGATIDVARGRVRMRRSAAASSP
jgi:tRNA (guanine37-N1)-methyltransferase